MEKPAEQATPTVAFVLLALFLFPFVLVLVPMFAAAWSYFHPIFEQVGFTEGQ